MKTNNCNEKGTTDCCCCIMRCPICFKCIRCPDCPECPECPDCPECPKCPDCPECPECPKCPDCPECPDCPKCPDCPDCPKCECPCVSKGQIIKNGGMEMFDGNVPTAWTAVGRVLRETARGRVHSGNSAVAIYNDAALSQIVPIEGGCFYELSFFGHGEGANVGLTATVTFLSADDSEVGLEIFVLHGDIPTSNRQFSFYNGITTRAPIGAIKAEIAFSVTSNGEQNLILDDVSFSVQ
ncbi:MAG: hypothetical protein FWF94_07500 [Oscillospiraceae bacterium]|nr:hypothetical protein [Oscillospiraceae bacterium]